MDFRCLVQCSPGVQWGRVQLQSIENLQSDYGAIQLAFRQREYATAQTLVRPFVRRVMDLCRVERHTRADHCRASIVIVSHRTQPILAPALAAIRDQTRSADAEVVLVSNGDPSLYQHFTDFSDPKVFVWVPLNVGCSLGRNIGAHFACGKHVIFLDDDGVIEPNCIARLLDRLTSTGAVSCRGRVIGLSNTNAAPPHYDLGIDCVPAVPNTEGVLGWDRDAFLEFGGFDPLLAGHEGSKLCCETYPSFGPHAFLYEPTAVIRHDYAESSEEAKKKAAKIKINQEYLDWSGVQYDVLRKTFENIRMDIRSRYLFTRWLSDARVPSKGDAERVSIITTAKDGELFVDDYSRSWQRQTLSCFEIVFVDDGSKDDTTLLLRERWRGDPRLRIIKTSGVGRSEALNIAIANAGSEICLIADIDDISRRDRIERTLCLFGSDASLDCLSFPTFNERSAYSTGRPHSPFCDDVEVRQLFGTPVPFPTFAFRKRAFQLPFDPTLPAAVDYDWLARNLKRQRVKGRMTFVPMAYRRVHDRQISRLHRERQLSKAIEIVHDNFSAVLGRLDDADRLNIAKLTRRAKTDKSELSTLYEWTMRFVAENRRKKVYPIDQLEQCLVGEFLELEHSSVSQSAVRPQAIPTRLPKERHSAPKGRPKMSRVETLLLKGNRLMSAGDFKNARRTYRKIRKLDGNLPIRGRILATRWPLSWAYRFFAKPPSIKQ